MYSIYRGTAYAERFVGRERVEFYEVGEGENFLCESLLTHVSAFNDCNDTVYQVALTKTAKSSNGN